MNATVSLSSAQFASACLNANIEALALTTRTRDRVMANEKLGTIKRLSDGNPAIVIDENIVLGNAPDQRTQTAWLSRIGQAADGVIVIFGLGAGHAVRHLRTRTNARLIVYEPDPAVLRAVLESGPTDLAPVPIVTELMELQTIWPLLARDRDSARMIVTPGYAERYPKELEAVTNEIHILCADINLIENTRVLRYQEWVTHILENVPVFTESSPFLGLKGKYKNVPAFIIGAGPSLAKNVELLRKAGKKGIIFAVDMSGRVLDKKGIEPQVLVCLEGMNLSHEMKQLSYIDRVIRAFSLTASPASLGMEGGPLLPFHETLHSFSPVNALIDVPGAVVGGSVTTVAFSLAEQLGCSPIVLVGQDLAYTDGRTHSAGTILENSRVATDAEGHVKFDWCDEAKKIREESELGPPPPAEQSFEVEAWGGAGKVVATASFNAFRLWFEVAAAGLILGKPDLRLINATEGGSRIKGFEERTLAEVVDSLEDHQVTTEEMVRQAKEARPTLSADQIIMWANDQRRLTEKAGKLALELAKNASRTRRKLDPENPSIVKANFAKLAKIEAQLREASQRQPMLEAWAYAGLQDATKEASVQPSLGDARADAEVALDTEIRFARELARAARDLSKAFKRLIARMDGTSPPSPGNERATNQETSAQARGLQERHSEGESSCR